MSGFVLDDEALVRVHAKMPNIDDIQLAVQSLLPDFISSKYPPKSEIPVAAVCLNDAIDALTEARYALHEFLAYRIQYLEKLNPPDEPSFAFYGRFYLEDIAIRLYSAGEHLANAIICMLEISSAQLQNHKKDRISTQSIVGNFLLREMYAHPITQNLIPLANSPDWQNTITYRNRLVHEQPPTIIGTGAVYKRQKRWQLSNTGKAYKLGLGGSDEAEYSLDQILAFTQPSTYLFADTLRLITKYYILLIEKKGVKITLGKAVEIEFSVRCSPTPSPAVTISAPREPHPPR